MKKGILITVVLAFLCNISAFGQIINLLSPTAKVEFDSGNFEPCIEEMTQLIQLNPNNDAAYLERGRCLFFSADYDKIREEKSKIITDQDKLTEATNLEFDLRRIRAIEDASKAISLNPNNALAYNLRGIVSSKIYADGDEAEQKRSLASIADYNKAIQIDPRLVKAYINRASEYYKNTDYEGALEDLETALSIEPNNQYLKDFMSTVLNRIKLTSTTTEDCLKSDHAYDCVSTLKKYADAHPNSAQAFLNLARVNHSVQPYTKIENRETYWKNAEIAYLKVIELNPKEVSVYTELYDLYIKKLGENNKANELLKSAEKQLPNNAKILELRGQNFLLLFDPVNALSYFDKSIAINPKNSTAFVGRGDANKMLKNYNQTLTDYTIAIEIDGLNGEAYLKRAIYFIEQKKYQEAIIDFNSAIQMNATCAQSYRGNAYTLMALNNNDSPNTGNFIKAKNDFLADNNDECFLTNYLYAQLLYVQGLQNDAINQFKLAKERFKKSSEASKNQIKTAEDFILSLEAELVEKQTPTTDPNIEKIIEAITVSTLSNGAELIAKGVTDFNKYREDKLFRYTQKGDVYLFAMVSEWDPNLSVGDQYDTDGGNRFDGDHIATFDKSTIDNYSVVIFTTIISPYSNIDSLHLQPSCSGLTHWVLFRKR